MKKIVCLLSLSLLIISGGAFAEEGDPSADSLIHIIKESVGSIDSANYTGEVTYITESKILGLTSTETYNSPEKVITKNCTATLPNKGQASLKDALNQEKVCKISDKLSKMLFAVFLPFTKNNLKKYEFEKLKTHYDVMGKECYKLKVGAKKFYSDEEAFDGDLFISVKGNRLVKAESNSYGDCKYKIIWDFKEIKNNAFPYRLTVKLSPTFGQQKFEIAWSKTLKEIELFKNKME